MGALRFAVIGDPVAHSKSPAMHAAAYRALGLPHSYEALRVAASDLPDVVRALREGRFAGVNVTVPHKQRVLALVDRVVPAAAAVGAANTLVRTPEGLVVAHNTDVPALREELIGLVGAASWSSVRALVLGSGGAAKAAITALRALGVAELEVRARSQPGWAPSSEREERTHLVVQATSAGMMGADPGESVADVVAWEALPRGAVAYEVVYAPAETPFLRAARRRGLRAENGLGMLVRQGALAFELWLGVRPPLDAMRSAVGG